MTSREPSKRRYTLTNLPLSIQTRILTYLCPPHQPFRAHTNRCDADYWLPFKDPPVTISLDCAESLTIPLPSELMSPALASPILAKAVVNLLGDRVSYLTHRNTSAQLSQWVKAFAPYVKAVSTQDAFPPWWVDDLCRAPRSAKCWFTTFETQIEHSLQLFKTLSTDAVTLEVLDLLDVHFLNFNKMEDGLMAGLCATLESNSATLRELALPVFHTSDVCDRALAMSSLEKLDVLTVKLWSMYVVDSSKTLPPPFLRMIRAIDGHADRKRKLTTLRELRFIQFETWEPRSLTPSDRNSSVFYSVKTLRLFLTNDVDTRGEIYPFISSFKNLQCLGCNLAPVSSDTRFAKLCAMVPEIHLSSSRWLTSSVQVGAKEHYADRCSLFEETSSDSKRFASGSIRTFFAGGVSRVEIRNMMNSCPSLENLSVHVSQENIRTIRKLLQKCQQMKCLELVVDEKQHGRLNDDDWRSISRIVPKSHRNLCQVAVQTVGKLAKSTPRMDAVFRCFETITKTIGERARRLAFRMVLRTRWGVKIIEKICGMVNVCLQHTPALESMECKMFMPNGDRSNYRGEWEQGVVKHLSQLETQLLREVKSLRMLDLGISPFVWKGVRGNHDTAETDSVHSDKESASS